MWGNTVGLDPRLAVVGGWRRLEAVGGGLRRLEAVGPVIGRA
jgi:hypothetical protein